MQNPNFAPELDLRAELAAIEAVDRSTPERLGAGWRTTRAQALLDMVVRKCAGTARRSGFTPEDAMVAALDSWRGAKFTIPVNDGDPRGWGWTVSAVRRRLDGERIAQSMLTTPGSRLAHDHAQYDFPAVADPADPAGVFATLDTPEQEPSGASEPALETAAEWLMAAGLNELAAWQLVDTLTRVVVGGDEVAEDGRPMGRPRGSGRGKVKSSASVRKSAVTMVQAARDRIAAETSTDPALVAETTSLLFGSRTRGGLLELRADGATRPELEAYAASFSARK